MCRVNGRLDDAEQYYRKSLTASESDSRTGKYQELDRGRAEASLAAVKFYKLNLDRITDGEYEASSLGYEDQVHIKVAVKAGRIESVRVTKHREKQFYSSITDTPRAIVEKQAVTGVDTTSSATITSEAIINATAKALAQQLD